MQLHRLHEANFTPEPDPTWSKKQGTNSEKSKEAEYPTRSGNLETPPSNPGHLKLMGVDKLHGTMGQKRGRHPSGGGRPKRIGQAKSTGSSQKDIVGSDADPTQSLPHDDAGNWPVDQPWAGGQTRMGEKPGTHKSNLIPSQTDLQAFKKYLELYGNRYPGRKV